ncbi:hypothetical protein [Winogradskyella aurantia]|uniref:RND transporter n=1 Tax=Winogradskyella aurantia TaxID=1915063 RepID=A0A265UUT7_9FLAO|nr:hypothetical protein [Winogradskyella aurantia]OZV69075.1 hypothetical protein CA834_06335 [Winogradskyella aurantia]
MQKFINDWRLVILLCLTLGLAPFLPEPHIVGKLRWIGGGGSGMGLMDYFDLVLHGFPFILLLRLLVKSLLKKPKPPHTG